MSAATATMTRERPRRRVSLGRTAIPFGVLGLIALGAILAEVIAPGGAYAQDIAAKLRPPSAAHLMGTDELGRDLFARVLLGARVSLVVGLGASLLGALVGSALGVTAAYLGGWWDDGFMRAVDIVIAFPAVILAMAVVAVAGSTLFNVVWVLAVVQMPIFARLSRAVVLGQLSSEYVTAARTLGVPPIRVVVRHLVPNSLAPLVAMAGLVAAGSILNEAALSFLGLGVAPPEPTWGNLLASGRLFLLVGSWWLTVFPGLAIFLTVLSFNVVSDALRDALDPRLRATT